MRRWRADVQLHRSDEIFHFLSIGLRGGSGRSRIVFPIAWRHRTVLWSEINVIVSDLPLAFVLSTHSHLAPKTFSPTKSHIGWVRTTKKSFTGATRHQPPSPASFIRLTLEGTRQSFTSMDPHPRGW